MFSVWRQAVRSNRPFSRSGHLRQMFPVVRGSPDRAHFQPKVSRNKRRPTVGRLCRVKRLAHNEEPRVVWPALSPRRARQEPQVAMTRHFLKRQGVPPREAGLRGVIHGRAAARRGATFDGSRGFQPTEGDDTGMIRRGATMEGGGHRRE